MTKKRRTKAQKIKTAVRRTETSNDSIATPSLAANLKSDAKPSKKELTKPELITQNKISNVQLIRTLRLVIFLIGAQVVLWILFKQSNIDNHIYEFIKL